MVRLDAPEAAGVTAAVATALAELHDAGEAHGGLAPELVVLGADGVRLLPDAHRLRTADRPAPASPADDVAALGTLIAWMLERVGASAAPRLGRARRPLGRTFDSLAGVAPRRRRASLRPPSAGEVLTDLADRCGDPDPRRRPSARSVAAAIRTGVPAARLPTAAAPELVLWPRATARGDTPLATGRPSTTGARGGRTRGRGLVFRLGVWTVATLGGAVVVATCFAPDADAGRNGAHAATSTGPSTAAGQARDVGATGGAATLPTVAVGGVLTAGGDRWVIGDADDHAVYAPFGCGPPALVVLRAPEGDVLRFDRLPLDEGGTTTGRRVAAVPDGVSLDATASGEDGCVGGVVVGRRSGVPVRLPVPPASHHRTVP